LLLLLLLLLFFVLSAVRVALVVHSSPRCVVASVPPSIAYVILIVFYTAAVDVGQILLCTAAVAAVAVCTFGPHCCSGNEIVL
jgi:hypothetical protein